MVEVPSLEERAVDLTLLVWVAIRSPRCLRVPQPDRVRAFEVTAAPQPLLAPAGFRIRLRS